MKSLYVYFEDRLIGKLTRDEELMHSFQYDESWLNSQNKFQLSLVLPLQAEPFGNKLTLSFFENLIPEGEVRQVLGKDYGIKSSFEFLKEFGKDCAGAIIVSSYSTSPFNKLKQGKNEIEMSEVYKAIDNKRSVAEVISQVNSGYLSLAGAQDKFAAIYERGKLFLPTNGAPTTHIVKVPIWRMGVKESVYNELYCMKLAGAVGLNVPNCFLLEESNHPLFIVERYDREIGNDGYAHRLHQQDFCQAQGIISDDKYEEKGGPKIRDNYELIRESVSIKNVLPSTFAFLDWVCFNLLIGNNDSHSKNISLLLKGDKTELAPFYDLLCTAIYPSLKRQFSFMIGDRNDSSRIGRNQLELLEVELGLKKGTMTDRMLKMKDKLLEHKDIVARELKMQHPKMKIAKRISDLIGDRCKALARKGVK